MKALIVTAPFGKYAKGEQITDADAIAEVLEEHSSQVVAVNLPDQVPGSVKEQPETDPKA
jgi:hypothetical protein